MKKKAIELEIFDGTSKEEKQNLRTTEKKQESKSNPLIPKDIPYSHMRINRNRPNGYIGVDVSNYQLLTQDMLFTSLIGEAGIFNLEELENIKNVNPFIVPFSAYNLLLELDTQINSILVATVDRLTEKFHKDNNKEEIKNIRKKLSLRQDEFAEKLGFDPLAILFWETGRIKPTEKMLTLIRKLGTEVE